MNKYFQVVGFGVLLLMALILLSENNPQPGRLLTGAHKATPTLGARATATTTATALSPARERREKEVRDLKTRVADPNNWPSTQKMLERRLEIAIYEATHIAIPPKPNHTPQAGPSPEPEKAFMIQREPGIVIVPVPFSPQYIRVNNTWNGQGAPGEVFVYAGYFAEDREQGIVVVRPSRQQDYKIYPTTAKVGGLEIVEYEGSVLTLKSDGGETFVFDVMTETYLDGAAPLTEPVRAEKTPQATGYPYP